MRTLIIVIGILIAGCSSTQTKQQQFTGVEKVGIVNLVENDPKLINMGVTIFSRNEQSLDLDWNISKRIDDEFSQRLSTRLVHIQPPKWLVDNGGAITSAGWSKFHLKDEYIPLVKELCEAEGVDVLTVVRSYSSSFYGKPDNLYGYGVYTRRALGVGHAAAFSSLWLSAFSCESPSQMLKVTTEQPVKVDEVTIGDSSTAVALSEIEKALPAVESITDKALETFLDNLAEMGI